MMSIKNKLRLLLFLLLFWSQVCLGQCTLDDFLEEIKNNGIAALFKEGSKDYFEAWKILYSEKDLEMAAIRQNPENLRKIRNYILAESPDVNLKALKKSFNNARSENHALQWIELKIPRKDLEDIANKLDPLDDPAPWTKEHKAQRWKNYQASDEQKLDFTGWSNNYDGNIDKATTANEIVESYVRSNGLVGFELEVSIADVEINLRSKNLKGTRRHDLFNDGTGEAIEIKDYRSQKVYLSEDIEREVLMDLKLLESGEIKSMKWVFLGEGPSEPLRKLLSTKLSNGKSIQIIP